MILYDTRIKRRTKENGSINNLLKSNKIAFAINLGKSLSHSYIKDTYLIIHNI